MALVPSDGTCFWRHISQAEIVDLTDVGEAAAFPGVRTSNGVAAALQDEGDTRPEARALGASTADSEGHSSGQLAVPLPGALAAVDGTGRRASVVVVIIRGTGPRLFAGPDVCGAPGDADDVACPDLDWCRCPFWLGS